VRRELRESVLFAVHDVLHDSPFSRLDLVACRNLLIYLTREAQARVFETLHFALLPHGKLFLGSSESVEDGSRCSRAWTRRTASTPARPRRAGLPLPQAPMRCRGARAQPQRERPRAPAAPSTAPAAARRRGRAHGAPGRWGELHLQLLERLAPPSMLVDGEYDIVHLSPSAGRFLQLAAASRAATCCAPCSRTCASSCARALYQAAQQGAEVPLPPVAWRAGGTVVALRVVPVTQANAPLFLVLFEVQPSGSESRKRRAQRHEADPLARYLDAEIERLKSHLRETVEQNEASTEELKASNEELQAMNERCGPPPRNWRPAARSCSRSTRSCPPSTASSRQGGAAEQRQQRHAELMDATRIATVFLDRELHITRFSRTRSGCSTCCPPISAGRSRTWPRSWTTRARRRRARVLDGWCRSSARWAVRRQLVPGAADALPHRGRPHRRRGASPSSTSPSASRPRRCGCGWPRWFVHHRRHHQLRAGPDHPELETAAPAPVRLQRRGGDRQALPMLVRGGRRAARLMGELPAAARGELRDGAAAQGRQPGARGADVSPIQDAAGR
jgi:hypothetical protein